ncbi:hypothetical protein AB0B12_23245 [Streptomyces sp. NPDC044780]|uniref:hypothetical protein n=1 Tax=unclassified Streptomyces TaxID=2593676 RepID=UPI0033E3A60D
MTCPAWCFVTVEWREETPPEPPPAPSLCLGTGRATGGGVLLARPGRAAAPRAAVLDEHLTVDADARPGTRWLDCADVLRGSRPRPAAEAVRWLADVRSSRPGCRLAAVPLAEGGWAAAAGTEPGVVVLPCGIPAEQWLFVSCLHAWLVAGLPLSGLLGGLGAGGTGRARGAGGTGRAEGSGRTGGTSSTDGPDGTEEPGPLAGPAALKGPEALEGPAALKSPEGLAEPASLKGPAARPWVRFRPARP